MSNVHAKLQFNKLDAALDRGARFVLHLRETCHHQCARFTGKNVNFTKNEQNAPTLEEGDLVRALARKTKMRPTNSPNTAKSNFGANKNSANARASPATTQSSNG